MAAKTEERHNGVDGDERWCRLERCCSFAPRSRCVAELANSRSCSRTDASLGFDTGYDVKPVFMRNWSTLDADDESGGCEWERDFADVQATCERHLSMQGRQCEPELLEFEREYFADVFQPALDAWQQGWTPNPDVACNRCVRPACLQNHTLC